MNSDRDLIVLHEIDETDVLLSSDEAAELQTGGLSVEILPSSADAGIAKAPYRVHGNHHVGYFRLKSARVVRIDSKVPIGNVLSLLALAYEFYADDPPFLDRTVPYSPTHSRPLQALVEHFVTLVETLLREGLLRRYIEQEENLSAIRGRLVFDKQVQQNLVRRNRIFCRFSNCDVDNVENRIVLWALLLLQRSTRWPERLKQKLQAQIMHFGGVSVIPIASKQVPGVIYDRLSGRYREIHAWCRFFIDQMTLLNESGKVDFQGFRLNMFELFERFVFCVFKQASRKWTGVRIDKTRFPLDTRGRVGILPDVLIRARSFLTVADAKYKLTQDAKGKHPDLYQVIAYSTALGLIEANHRPQALLVYPASERTTVFEGDLHVLTSAKGESRLSVRTLWLDLTSDNVIQNSISKADGVLSEAAHMALVSVRPSVPKPEGLGPRHAG